MLLNTLAALAGMALSAGAVLAAGEPDRRRRVRLRGISIAGGLLSLLLWAAVTASSPAGTAGLIVTLWILGGLLTGFLAPLRRKPSGEDPSSPRIATRSDLLQGAAQALAVFLVGIWAALIFVPNRLTSCGSLAHESCIANLKQLDSAAEMYAMDHRLSDGAPVKLKSLQVYLRRLPICPSGGRYPVVLRIGSSPTCSVGGNGDRDPRNDHTL